MITVFTPIHRLDNESLHSLCKSLSIQTNADFEWVVMLNGPILLSGSKSSLKKLHEIIGGYDINARILTSSTKNNIGALKAECCENAAGSILVELDYDDLLTHNALQVIQEAFDTSSEVNFFYSNCWEFTQEGNTNELYGAYYGWKNKPYMSEMQNVSFPALPQYLRRIEWSPNHVRAFRRLAYEQVGGYDKTIEVGDDHDLMCRFYLTFGEAAFYDYDDVLYHYRVH